MKFFSRLALHVLHGKIEKIELGLKSNMDHSCLSSLFTILPKSMLSTIATFKHELIPVFQNDNTTDEALLVSLLHSISEFQAKMNSLRAQHSAHSIDYSGELKRLLYVIKEECLRTDTWDTDCDDCDPFTIFRRNMISYIVLDLCEYTSEIEMIREKIYNLKKLQPTISDSSKFAYLHSMLADMFSTAQQSQSLQRFILSTRKELKSLEQTLSIDNEFTSQEGDALIFK